MESCAAHRTCERPDTMAGSCAVEESVVGASTRAGVRALRRNLERRRRSPSLASSSPATKTTTSASANAKSLAPPRFEPARSERPEGRGVERRSRSPPATIESLATLMPQGVDLLSTFLSPGTAATRHPDARHRRVPQPPERPTNRGGREPRPPR